MIEEQAPTMGLDLVHENRYKCIADYPRNMRNNAKLVENEAGSGVLTLCPHYHKGQILRALDPKTIGIWDEQTKQFFDKYPALFKPLFWWQYRTIDQLCSVKFVLILTNDHPIYQLGDQVRVLDYQVNTKPLRFGGYFLKDYDPEFIIKVQDCMPTDQHLIQKPLK